MSKGPEERRAEILAVAQGLFLVNGYDHTSVRQIIDAVGIAKGTFYHHFESKLALVDALAVTMNEQARLVMEPILNEAGLSPSARINKIFDTVGMWKVRQKDLLIQLLAPMRNPANAAFRERVEAESLAGFIPMLGGLIQEGVEAGEFDVFDATEAARIVISISRVTGHRITDLLLAPHETGTLAEAEAAVLANQQAVARVLGTKPGVVHLISMDMVRGWFE